MELNYPSLEMWNLPESIVEQEKICQKNWGLRIEIPVKIDEYS
jgi:hypothetical protein